MTIGEGVQLNLTYTELLKVIPNDTTLTTMIKPYLGAQGATVKCVGTAFPLILSDAQSN